MCLETIFLSIIILRFIFNMDLENGSKAEYIQEQRTMKKPLAGGYGGVEDRSTWIRLKPSHKNFQWAELSFNPVVTFISLAIILAFALWAMILPDNANTEFAHWKTWVGINFTWLYIGSQVAMPMYKSQIVNLSSGCLGCLHHHRLLEQVQQHQAWARQQQARVQ